jgi:tRNA (mo5U34)-methyltransferase
VSSELRTRIASNQLWYHTLELAPGVETPGWFDLRPVLPRIPFPDVRGKRCLDIATYDGFFAFEMERRGAAEVVATDVPSHADWDHLPRYREEALAFWAANGGEKGAGFTIAAEALGSKVHRELINVYDMSPERLGTFDVVVLGSILLHLRAPFDALAAIRSVCAGQLLSMEQISPAGELISRRVPLTIYDGHDGRWAVPNTAGHRKMLDIAGFDVVRRSGRYMVPFGSSHPARRYGNARTVLKAAANRVVTGDFEGVPHAAALCRPAV